MILNTGDVPNIYEHDEKAEIIEKVLHVSSFTGIQKVFLNPRSLDLFRPPITEVVFCIRQSPFLSRLHDDVPHSTVLLCLVSLLLSLID